MFWIVIAHVFCFPLSLFLYLIYKWDHELKYIDGIMNFNNQCDHEDLIYQWDHED